MAALGRGLLAGRVYQGTVSTPALCSAVFSFPLLLPNIPWICHPCHPSRPLLWSLLLIPGCSIYALPLFLLVFFPQFISFFTHLSSVVICWPLLSIPRLTIIRCQINHLILCFVYMEQILKQAACLLSNSIEGFLILCHTQQYTSSFWSHNTILRWFCGQMSQLEVLKISIYRFK